VHGQGPRPAALRHQLQPEEHRLHDPLRPLALATGAQAAGATRTHPKAALTQAGAPQAASASARPALRRPQH
jgi:hypothetical protein